MDATSQRIFHILVGISMLCFVNCEDYIVDIYKISASDSDVAPSPDLPSFNISVEVPPSDPLQDGQFLDRFCKGILRGVNASFRNPSYPMSEVNPLICQFLVVPMKGYCALRVDFAEAEFTPKGEGCSSDTFQILNSLDTPAVPQCGFMTGYQFTVRTVLGRDVTLLITSQSETKWDINVTQIPCNSIQEASDLLPKECGKAGEPSIDFRNGVNEEIKLILPTELLKDDNISFPYAGIQGPQNLLKKALVVGPANLRIVNGNVTGVNEFPWQVLILALGKPLCGGTLISDQFVVTAGHCTSLSTKLPLASLLMVDLGDHDLMNSKESINRVYGVERIIPNIKHDSVHNDISILKLNKKVEFNKAISPICLPKSQNPAQNYEGEVAITSGWGKTGDSVISPVLRKAELEIIPLDTCRQLWDLVGAGGGEIIENSMICAGGGNVGPCNGDSGGPLIVKDKARDQYNLVGVTSFGALRGCALEGVPTVFTRVTSFLDWILLNIALT